MRAALSVFSKLEQRLIREQDSGPVLPNVCLCPDESFLAVYLIDKRLAACDVLVIAMLVGNATDSADRQVMALGKEGPGLSIV